MTDLASVLAGFKAASGYDASVWANSGGALRREASTDKTPAPPATLPAVGERPVGFETKGGNAVVAAIPGTRTAWLVVAGEGAPSAVDANLAFLLPVVAQLLQSALEVEHAANELAERYEEINLLYTTSEILGRTVDLEVAANQILAEISDTVGARRAAVQVHDATRHSLVAVAALGARAADLPAIAVDDTRSISARVFRTCHPTIVDGEEPIAEAERLYRRGAMLSVPIMWTSPGTGSQPLGVVSLSDRRSGQPFTASDQKLISAIATQIGTAIQNAKLVSESLSQQRLRQEMQLAHDLQMRLLPDVSSVAPTASVAARVVPAESVGGDLYNLFRLGSGKTGVMVGDVSGHGYQAALVMALTMSASAIHAQTTADPGETLSALLASLDHELTEAEMFVSMFYGVIDRTAGRLRYANAGHPHAFVISRRGVAERLPAIDPPLGMGSHAPTGRARPWTAGDVLLLFTDGVSDARDREGNRLGEDRILDVAKRYREDPPDKLLNRLFEVLDQHTGDTQRRDDLTIVVLRS